jgi:type VI secretion system secreted protein VgrG
VRFATPRDSAERSDAARVDTFTRFAAQRQVTTNTATRAAWDYKRLAGLNGSDDDIPDGLPALEHYDGAGAYRYASTEHAQRAAALALQSNTQHVLRFEAQGSVRSLAAGQAFRVQEHPSLDGDYTALQVRIEAVNNLGAQAAQLLGRTELDKGQCRSRLLAQPAAVPLLPKFVRKPTAPGVQTALVVGLESEPVFTERGLRVKVQFPWQRGLAPNAGGLPHDERSADDQGNAPGNEASGTWVRVAQRAAGANWGTVFVPRIGTEVLVDFVEGDIDRPLIVGQLHNGQDAPPFAAGIDSGVNHPGTISGVHSPTLDRGGYNEWTVDDATGQLRMRLLSSYTMAEIGLGHLIQQAPANAQRGSARGAGFELGTQGWGSLRAGKGLLLSTTARAGSYGSAESTQMDAAESVAQLKAAQHLGQRLNDVAQPMKAQALKSHAVGQSVEQLLQGLDPQQQGRYDSAVNGQEAKKEDASRALTEPVERPDKPTVTLDTPSTLAQLTEAGIAHFAGQDSAWVSQGDWHETAAHTFSLVSGRTASWYAHDSGIQLKAANGPVSLRAHTDRLEILADQDVQVLSVNDEIVVSAQTKIALVGGDSSIVLDGGNIDFITPGSFVVKAATHEWEGAGSGAAALPSLPSGQQQLPPASLEVQQLYHDDEGVQAAPFVATLGDGSRRSGITDAAGIARLDGLPPGPVNIQFEPDGRAWARLDGQDNPGAISPAPGDSDIDRLIDRTRGDQA